MKMSNILITGSGKGLGLELVKKLSYGHNVYQYDHETGKDVRKPDLSGISDLDILINNAGVNLINWLEDFEESQWDQVLDTNAKGIYLMSKACLPMLIKSKGTIINIVSNAAHVPMTCSLAYNASKGAAHIMTLQLARELTKKHGITVFGIAPNKMKGTGMSDSIDDQVTMTRGWTKEEAQKYQLNGLLAGEETPPEMVALFISYLIQDKDHHKYLSGCILPYGA
jgi:NAD(P)-dependent dehydrogenase (short-subunit alcohol dehydrogenase family)